MTRPDINWPSTTSEAREMQERDRRRVRIVPLLKDPKTVAGADASFSGDLIFGAVCVYSYPELVLLEQATANERASFPYVPGYLLFREGPALMAAVRKLKLRPDVIFLDGQGTAHPRGIGSASHLGVLLDIPTVGCAKTRLVGDFRGPGPRKGSWTPLEFEGRGIGAVIRTKDRTRPLFVSPGNLIDLQGATELVLGCTGRYRLPEPLRCADILSRKQKRISDAD